MSSCFCSDFSLNTQALHIPKHDWNDQREDSRKQARLFWVMHAVEICTSLDQLQYCNVPCFPRLEALMVVNVDGTIIIY